MQPWCLLCPLKMRTWGGLFGSKFFSFYGVVLFNKDRTTLQHSISGRKKKNTAKVYCSLCHFSPSYKLHLWLFESSYPQKIKHTQVDENIVPSGHIDEVMIIKMAGMRFFLFDQLIYAFLLLKLMYISASDYL